MLAALGRYLSGFSAIVAFVFATIALAGMAWIVSMATEQVGERFGPAITGALQSSVGNLPEFFVVLFALQAHQTVVAETALVGSILVNALLVLGLVLVAGSSRAPDGVMRFSKRLPNDTATLLLVASFTIVLLGIVNSGHDPAALHTRTISIVGAAAILFTYLIWVRGYLRQPADAAPGIAQASAGPDRDQRHVAGHRRRWIGVRLGLVRACAGADDPHAASLAGVRRARDRRDRGERCRERGRNSPRAQGSEPTSRSRW